VAISSSRVNRLAPAKTDSLLFLARGLFHKLKEVDACVL
jgi:hypothetical protein